MKFRLATLLLLGAISAALGQDMGSGINNPGASSGGGSGTVTSVSVATANGISGSVANPTTTPAITLTLGAITPTSAALNGATLGTANFSSNGPFLVSGADEVFTPYGSSNITFAVQRNAVTTSTFPFFNSYFALNYSGTNTSASMVGLETDATVVSTVSTNVAGLVAFTSTALHNGTGTVAIAQGAFSNILNKSTGTITAAQALQVAVTNNTGGTITTAEGIQIKQPKGGASSVWTNTYGIEIQDQKPSGTNTVTNPPIGLLIDSQTSAGAYAIQQNGSGLNLFAGATTFSASLQIGAPTGGNEGTGTINAAGAYYANGTKGVTCSGALTVIASITITNGIITAATGTGGTCS
jgi:hypothetical protein